MTLDNWLREEMLSKTPGNIIELNKIGQLFRLNVQNKEQGREKKNSLPVCKSL